LGEEEKCVDYSENTADFVEISDNNACPMYQTKLVSRIFA